MFFIALNWLLTTSTTTKTRLCHQILWQDFVTVIKYRLVSTDNGQLNTRTWVILLWATEFSYTPQFFALSYFIVSFVHLSCESVKSVRSGISGRNVQQCVGVAMGSASAIHHGLLKLCVNTASSVTSITSATDGLRSQLTPHFLPCWVHIWYWTPHFCDQYQFIT